jgi:hypothetical protein
MYTNRPQGRVYAISVNNSTNSLLAQILPPSNVRFERVGMVGAVLQEVVAHRLLDVDVVCLLEWES